MLKFNGIYKLNNDYRCYTKYDIDKKVNCISDDEDILESLSDYEVFITNSKDIIFIENIFTKCTVR